jgi:Hypervirulence associated proteins TUDOR domain
MMEKRFKVGDLVTWNSEAGHVSGTIIKIHTKDFDYKGHTHHASEDDPQYEIKSAKTDHIAAHKGHALKKASA